MKILRTEFLICSGEFAKTKEFDLLFDEISTSIKHVTWPDSSPIFQLFPGKNENGVKPIKNQCTNYLSEKGWILEKPMNLGSRISPGPVDAVKTISGFGEFAFEWETGNISSSHRALNKMSLGLLSRTLIGGVLIVPSRDFYFHLTDRIGNFAELEPYFPVWKSIWTEGVLAVIEVEHDILSTDVPKIPKGTDGRALR